MIVSIKNRRIFLFFICILEYNILLSNPHQPIIIQQGQQKSWCDYAFLAATITISSVGFLGRYVWLQNKKIEKLEENDQKNSKLLDTIQSISTANSEKLLSLQSCQSNISDKLQELTSKTCSVESLLGQTRKFNGLNLWVNFRLDKQLKQLAQENKNSFEKLRKTIAGNHEASAKNECEILELLGARSSSKVKLVTVKFSNDDEPFDFISSSPLNP